MMHHWMTVVFAANWGFAALMLAVGCGVGWWLRSRAERAKVPWPLKIDALPSLSEHQRADTPGPGKTQIASQQPVFQTQSGQVIESPRTWDQRLARFGGPEQIPYEELEGMFLDQFLLRFFYSLMPEPSMPLSAINGEGRSLPPWECFIALHPWAKEMPVLFEQMTGYKLNELQLNNAIAEWARRLSKSTEVVK